MNGYLFFRGYFATEENERKRVKREKQKEKKQKLVLWKFKCNLLFKKTHEKQEDEWPFTAQEPRMNTI